MNILYRVFNLVLCTCNEAANTINECKLRTATQHFVCVKQLSMAVSHAKLLSYEFLRYATPRKRMTKTELVVACDGSYVEMRARTQLFRREGAL